MGRSQRGIVWEGLTRRVRVWSGEGQNLYHRGHRESQRKPEWTAATYEVDYFQAIKNLYHGGHGGSQRNPEWTAAADEVDDFEAVAIFQDGLRPAFAGGDFTVEFDGYAVGFHAQGFDEGGQRKSERDVWKGVSFSVDAEIHWCTLSLGSTSCL